MPDSQFVLDLKEIRRNARQHIEDGAVTEGYHVNVDNVVQMLNAALATEVTCVLRYKQHYHMCAGMNAEPVAAEFLEHALQEQDHADQLAGRIAQLGGKPDLNPRTLHERSHSEYVEETNVRRMVEENLVAERIAIDSYREMIRFVGDEDPTTRRLLEEILGVEEEHADDLANLLAKT